MRVREGMKRSISGALALALGVGLMASACGPVTSTQRLNEARTAFALAEDAGAAQHAVYEYTMAQQMLLKARQEWGQSDWQKAEEYADRAREYSERAATRATRRDPAIPGERR